MKAIPGFDGYYATRDGKIQSRRRRNPVWLKCRPDVNGYRIVVPIDNNGRAMTMKVHRMIASVFCENDDPSNKTQVHHIDHDRTNNRANNLRWVTCLENIQEKWKANRGRTVPGLKGILGKDHPSSKLVRQLHPEDGVVAVYYGLQDAARKGGFNSALISACCLGKIRTHSGFIWRYVF